MNSEEIYRHTLLTLSSFGDVIELRLIFPNGKIEAFQGVLTETSLHSFAGLIRHFDKKCQVEMSLNPLVPHTTSGKKYARNDRVAYRRFILIDVDSVTLDGAAADDEGKAMCYEVVQQIKQYLAEAGFCSPLLADSGNAFHLIYHAGNIPNDIASADLIRAFLSALKSRFATASVTVDTATANAGRLVKVYGVHSMKPPHRLSRILEIPNDWRTATVTPEHLQHIVSQNPTERTYSADSFKKMKPRELIKSETELVLKLLDECGITVQSIQNLDDGGKKYSLVGCPFVKPGSTRQTSCLFINKSGKMSLSCLHDSCYDYDIQSFLLDQLNQKIITKMEE